MTSNFHQVVAVGTSTGGPRALKQFLSFLPDDFSTPILIVQHMPPKFTRSLAQRLDEESVLKVCEAEQDMMIEPRHVYIAPGGYHMTLGADYRIALSQEDPQNGHRPSVDVLFDSLLPLKQLKRHIVLLTGMGQDGAYAMLRLFESGVTSTFAQTKGSCVVYGMPRVAVELGCVKHLLPLQELALKLDEVIQSQ